MDKRLSPVHSSKLKKIIFSEMTNICRNQVLHTGVHLISADVIILLIGAVNSNTVEESRVKHEKKLLTNAEHKGILLQVSKVYDGHLSACRNSSVGRALHS